MSRTQVSMVKNDVENMTKITFTKISSTVNYVIITVSVIANVLMDSSDAYKEEIRNEMRIIQKWKIIIF